jgi:hypothetical protein
MRGAMTDPVAAILTALLAALSVILAFAAVKFLGARGFAMWERLTTSTVMLALSIAAAYCAAWAVAL